METLLELRKQVYAEIEKLRSDKIVGSSLECHVSGPFSQWNEEEVLDVLVVSQISFSDTIEVSKANGTKCERCFKVLVQSCERCS